MSGFFVAPTPRPFVTRHVSLSDPATASDVEPSNDDKSENLSGPVASNDDASKSSEKDDRHTLYVGNLPYGTFCVKISFVGIYFFCNGRIKLTCPTAAALPYAIRHVFGRSPYYVRGTCFRQEHQSSSE